MGPTKLPHSKTLEYISTAHLHTNQPILPDKSGSPAQEPFGFVGWVAS